MEYVEALAYLDEHSNYEKTGRVDSPTVEPITRIMHVMADPHLAYPVVHVTGTNGKGSTTQIVTRLLVAHGLRVGTYTSPHLERLTERISVDGEPIDESDFAAAIAAIANVEVLSGVRPTYFEALTAAAFRHFADVAVDVAVVEVGMLGRWDATNVVRSEVAVVTNIDLDHTEYAGPTLTDIAREKSGISKAGSVFVVGDVNPDLDPVWSAAERSRLVRRGIDFDCSENRLAVGGRQVDLHTTRREYRDLLLPLHGRHQGENLAVAVAAVEEFFDAPLDGDVVADGLSAVRMPGRFEVVRRAPLVVLDGAHNPAGAAVCGEVYFEDFAPAGARTLIVGTLSGRDPGALLEGLRVQDFDRVVCCTAPSSRGLPAEDLEPLARERGATTVVVRSTVEEALDREIALADETDAILVAGSLYVVGAARTHLRRSL